MSLNDAFLLAVFRPSKNAMPKGIRHTTVKPLKGRQVSRVNQWNKFPGWKQEVIRQTGNTENFLRGKITFTDAKRDLRNVGVSRGTLKPLRVRKLGNLKDKQRAAGHHVFDLAMDTDSQQVSPLHIAESAKLMDSKQAQTAIDLRTPEELQYQAKWHPLYDRRDDERSMWLATTEDGVEINVLWYH